MNYIELNCKVFPAEPASDILMAQLADIGYESFMESDTGLLAYIPEEHFDAAALNELPVITMGMFDISFEYAEIEQENWNALWESNYEPVTIAGRCHVRAPFHEPLPTADYDIVVEPKMSFGTAHHETTFLTVQLMLDVDFSGKSVLDMGSGTGILSILASKMGAAKVVGIDNERWAYENAIENFERNNITNAEVIHGDAANIPEQPFDIVLANINRNTLLQDMAAYSEVLKSKGIILLSGFYEHERSIMLAEAEKYGIHEVRHIEKNDWVAIEAKK